MRILAINPGASSTKIGVYEDDKALLEKVILHSAQQLSSLSGMVAARAFRRGLVLQALREAGLPLRFDAIIGRGGLLRPLSGGVYEVDEAMCTALQNAPRQHPCNLGSILAYELSQQCDCPAMMADPGVVTEMDEVSFLSGSPLIRRECFWHALNQKAVARRYARSVGKRYEDLRLIVCHMGSGISVASHCEGRAIDVNNALDGEGSFSVGRSGSLPVLPLIRLCYSGRFTETEMEEHIMRGCGLQGYLGTSDMREVMQRVEAGDTEARLAVDAMVFQTSKEIAAQSAVLSGQVDAILITGGLAHVPYVTEGITRRVGHIAAVSIYPGEDELAALARNALAVLKGEKELKHYTPEPWELAKANIPTQSAAAGHRTRSVVAAILAGGTGQRLGADKPKQFLEIAGKTVLEHAVDAFVQCAEVDEVIIVCHADYVERLKEQVRQTARWKKVRDVVCGGSDRTGSSLQAIRWCASRDVDLLLHDAARPFVPRRVISDVCHALLTAEAVNVVMPAADTVLLAEGDHVTSIPDRCTVRRVQTPQGFRLTTIAAAYDKATKDPAFRATDDFSVVHKYLPNARYALVAGDENARKITYPTDLSYFRAVCPSTEKNA